ncbi:Crp/Fnr family transcriptional regulator [Methylomonas sp. HW2-6]|uniref:Crp/Fnr family transcriptional regulator n=1 Tax=Methylomonas sp. HW2-6 TaxID=3376687 RepID=UPI0040427B32
MPSIPAAPVANRLLAALPDNDRQHLLEHCEPVELAFCQVLYLTGARIPHVYFPTSSFISLVTPTDGDTGLEVGLIGNEGMLGITLILGVDIAPFQALVQGAGSALRIGTPLFMRELARSGALQTGLKRYLYVSMSQLAQTAACNRYHQVEPRLARWLLMTHDRAHADTFHVTHIFLAYILGVRRVGITKAALSLQEQKLIRYRRGDITILDRRGLEAAACGCYKTERETYERILGCK